jgi:hypothetical protein
MDFGLHPKPDLFITAVWGAREFDIPRHTLLGGTAYCFHPSAHPLGTWMHCLPTWHPLCGATQTCYFIVKQDEGHPTWEHFCKLYCLQFGLPVRDSRLA